MKKLGYTKKEIGDLLISTLALGFSFTVLLFKPSFINFFIAFFLSILCFIPRELIQRVLARKMAIYSQYKIWFPGIIIAIISSFFGFVFAAPGHLDFSLKYYERYGRKQIGLSLKQAGLIAFSGISFNLILGFIFMLLSLSGSFILSVIAKINFFIAFFNLIPVGNLDGVKVIRWSPLIWFISILLSLGLLILAYFIT